MRVVILTISDRCHRGERQDLTGPALRERLQDAGAEVIDLRIIPDEKDVISAALREACDNSGADVVLTNGGTGFGPRDVTPEATEEVIERRVPGLPEAMRVQTYGATPKAMLSRATAGIRGKTLIVNLPGNPKAAPECLEVILPVLPHAVELLRGEVTDCAPPTE